MIHIEGSTDVTLAFEDNDGWIFRENFQILGTITIGSNVLKKKLGQKVVLDQVYSWIESNCIWKFVSPKYNCIHEVNRIVFVVFRARLLRHQTTQNMEVQLWTEGFPQQVNEYTIDI